MAPVVLKRRDQNSDRGGQQSVYYLGPDFGATTAASAATEGDDGWQPPTRHRLAMRVLLVI
jgi:hypothetical protein